MTSIFADFNKYYWMEKKKKKEKKERARIYEKNWA